VRGRELEPAPAATATASSRFAAKLVTVSGAVLLGTGVVLYAIKENPMAVVDKPTFRNTGPAGVVVGGAGLATMTVGVILWLRGGNSTPAVAVDARSAFLGWAGRF
jgi:hypothetical protein